MDTEPDTVALDPTGLRWPSVMISYSLRNCFAALLKLLSVFEQARASFPRNVRYQSSATCWANERLPLGALAVLLAPTEVEQCQIGRHRGGRVEPFRPEISCDCHGVATICTFLT